MKNIPLPFLPIPESTTLLARALETKGLMRYIVSLVTFLPESVSDLRMMLEVDTIETIPQSRLSICCVRGYNFRFWWPDFVKKKTINSLPNKKTEILITKYKQLQCSSESKGYISALYYRGNKRRCISSFEGQTNVLAFCIQQSR